MRFISSLRRIQLACELEIAYPSPFLLAPIPPRFGIKQNGPGVAEIRVQESESSSKIEFSDSRGLKAPEETIHREN